MYNIVRDWHFVLYLLHLKNETGVIFETLWVLN